MPHRPLWLQTIPADVDAMAHCLEPREAPRYVVLIVHAADASTAITTLDAYGALEHCVVQDGRVVLRQPSSEQIDALEGLPRFSLGPTRPRVPRGTALEEIAQAGASVGWLHWPKPTCERGPERFCATVPKGER